MHAEPREKHAAVSFVTFSPAKTVAADSVQNRVLTTPYGHWKFLMPRPDVVRCRVPANKKTPWVRSKLPVRVGDSGTRL